MTVRTRVAAALGIAGAAWLATAGCNAGPGTQEVAAIDTLALGEKIIYTSNCVDCHTPAALYGAPDFERNLAGSDLGWAGPWGISFAKNLTPGNKTGIASWTDEQVITAIRTGLRPDGSTLLPPMPWPNFSKLTDLEAIALVRYLRTLPPIEHTVPAAVPPGVTPPAGTAVVYIPPPAAWDAPAEGAAGH